MRIVNAAPKASILIESLRDIGYSLESALADVIDNSIAAGATSIQLYASSKPGEQRIAILDNGRGMTEAELLLAMRPGSQNPLEDRPAADLGRFGLGLKTASFSQCRRMTVVTRKDHLTSAAIWDLDYVARTDDWVVQIPSNPEELPWAKELGETGTLVLWENLDRLVDLSCDEKGHTHFIRQIDEARHHLELVFHRYLAGERGLRKVGIALNGRPLEPFDPFNSGHPATNPGPVEHIKVGDHEVTVQAFTLPHHRKVTPGEWERYAGRGGYLRNQGFYVYREKRLIIHGTWFGLARQMELTKLARVKIDMPNGLDAHWKIDVKKASAHPPPVVKDRLRRIIEVIGATSKRVYTARGRQLVSDNRLPVWSRMQNKNEIVYRLNPEHPVIAQFTSKLPSDLKTEFLQVLELAGATLPMDALFADLGGEPERVAGNALSGEALQYTVETTMHKLREAGFERHDIMEMLRVTEPFRSNWENVEAIIQKIGAGELQSV